MKHVIPSMFIVLAFLSGACEEHEKMCCAILEENELQGKWLLYETGYSPGMGYITEPVPALPAQTLTVDNLIVSSTVDGMEDFRFYRILTDTATTPDSPYIAFYTEDPGEQPDPSIAAATYNFYIEGNTLTLGFRWCYEGCHLAFRKID